LIVLNKIDVTGALEGARKRLESYRALGYTVVEVSIKTQPDAARPALLEHLQGHSTCCSASRAWANRRW
jgi:Predicted GTPases